MPARWAEDFPDLRDAVRGLTAHQRVHPRHVRDQSFPAELIAAIAVEAEKAVAAGGYLYLDRQRRAHPRPLAAPPPRWWERGLRSLCAGRFRYGAGSPFAAGIGSVAR